MDVTGQVSSSTFTDVRVPRHMVSEVDVTGRMLSTFTDVGEPCHLSLDSQGRVLVADDDNNRILLLTSQLQLQRVLIDTNSQVKLRRPRRLYFNEHTSELYIAHSGEFGSNWSGVISLFILTEAE